ncbi:histone-lysine N-methyltransferase SUVR4 [Senna tora]|uniref:Histone-lysine N-methyltransferase SUVR4 n=1 Tax=Senna tora TaxID=362788 RepID=A0A834SK41_9FABA|nr:histone-lysine N-methyltransferase SUVR4 [Senna tora]
MAPNPRVIKAFNAMRELGFSHDEVKPVLQKLIRVYDTRANDENWELIEKDNYRTLIDAYFEFKEDKEAEHNSKAPVSHHNGEGQTQKLHSSTMVNSRQLTSVKENETHPNTFEQEIIESSQSLMSNKRAKISLLETNTEKASSASHGEGPVERPSSAHIRRGDILSNSCKKEIMKPKTEQYKLQLGPSSTGCTAIAQDEKHHLHFLSDIAKGSEKVKISLVDEFGNEELPKFNYIPDNLIYQSANVNISLARIADEGCCSDCSGNCLSAPLPCACAQETGGEFAYTTQGLLKEEFLTACLSMKKEPQDHHFVYCQECPLERSKNEYMPELCKGHLIRKFIKECWRKCGCDMQCGNRIVQRGLRCKLQVFFTREGKGWGVRTLEDLPKGSFVCEYVGEILTNMELYERTMQKKSNDKHTYPVTLDADWGSEGVLKDEEALCLDATYNGNVARFINHRCADANLIDIPVEVETPDRHYYHLAFFTNKEVKALEEVTWDYGIDFDDHDHPIKAFRCCCGSAFCRDKKRKVEAEAKTKQHRKGACLPLYQAPLSSQHLLSEVLEASEEEESPWQPLRWINRADFLTDGLDRDHGWGPARPHLEGPCSAQPDVSFRARKGSHPLNLNRVNLGRS